jgi:hypothetical protein
VEGAAQRAEPADIRQRVGALRIRSVLRVTFAHRDAPSRFDPAVDQRSQRVAALPIPRDHIDGLTGDTDQMTRSVVPGETRHDV